MAEGQGVIVAIPDSGIALNRAVFRRADGSLRIIGLWDQTVPYNSEAYPNKYGLGRIYTQEELAEAIAAGARPGYDTAGHGTAVAGIIAEQAPEAELLIIKLSGGNREGFAKTTSIMFAMDYIVTLAGERGMPFVINLSYGNNNGGHDGRALLEEYLNSVAESFLSSIVVATGNEGLAAHHKELNLNSEQSASFLVGPGENRLSLVIWLSFFDECEITIISPSGERHTILPGFDMAVLDSVRVAILDKEPTPLNINREIRLLWPEESAPAGLWELEFNPGEIRLGDVNMWLPISDRLRGDTRFTDPTQETTLTIPSTASRVISVGAFNQTRNSLAPFSGQGYTTDNRIKPDVVAPGVDVPTLSQTGRVLSTGTSFAAPFVSAMAAKLMSEGIVEGNDPFLYGERLKAFIIREAESVAGAGNTPNPNVGWGRVE